MCSLILHCSLLSLKVKSVEFFECRCFLLICPDFIITHVTGRWRGGCSAFVSRELSVRSDSCEVRQISTFCTRLPWPASIYVRYFLDDYIKRKW